MDPFPSRRSDNEPYFDTDLYAIHTLMLTSTIHLYSNNITPHFYYAVQTLIQFINFLLPEDYHYLDPILAVYIYYPLFDLETRLLIDLLFFFLRDIDLLVHYYRQLSTYRCSYLHWGFNGPLSHRLPYQ